MIHNIAENTLRITAKADQNSSIQAKETALQKVEQVRQARPVEKPESGMQANTRNPSNEDSSNEDSSKYLIEDNKLVYEKYDSKGEVVMRIPPSHKPVDERV
ncbi:MAG: hypothetical protein GY874_23240 [Desulfobacteraceae bacterium]|nr:hypothetical protein [Desulfobacteraceae bacterium]